jgi:hypothetical protein
MSLRLGELQEPLTLSKRTRKRERVNSVSQRESRIERRNAMTQKKEEINGGRRKEEGKHEG